MRWTLLLAALVAMNAACSGGNNPSSAGSGDAATAEASDDVMSAGNAGNDGDGAVDAASSNGPKHVFVSSALYTADLGGAAGADKKCQALAKAAGLGGAFRAWIGDATGSPSTRFERSPHPYVLVDGSVIASDWAALTTDLPLHHAINLTETGHTPPSGPIACAGNPGRAWSNANADGTPSNPSGPCADWSSSIDSIPQGLNHFMGTVGTTDGHWAASCTSWGPACGWQFPIYCFEQ